MGTSEERIWLEIINPSDKCCILGNDKHAAQFAVMFMSKGYYGLDGPDGTWLPIMAFCGGPEFQLDFFKGEGVIGEETTLETLNDALGEWLKQNDLRIINALESVTYGSREECESQYRALELIDDPEKKEIFIRENEDRRRSSMNAIVQSARDLAKMLRKVHVKEVAT